MKLNEYILIIDIIAIIALSIIHFVFYFFIEKTNYENLFDAFESSPFYDFKVDDNCGANDNLVFHRWEGRKETEYYWRDGRYRSREIILDETDITLINGNKFCYNKKKTYRELLNNKQIIKKDENCNENFPKNCGTIDTLEQQLCVSENEDCPLYDIRLNPDNIDENNYDTDTDKNSKIYYNKKNYDNDKKIIGKLLLNHGTPCYNLNEQLWKHFSDDEAGEEHLKCELSIFGKNTDDRYEEVGKISYRKIYQDNLGGSTKSWDLFKNIGETEKLTLYKRVFLGIDKDCDDDKNVFHNNYNKLTENQEREKNLILAESIIMFVMFDIIISSGSCIIKSDPGHCCFIVIIILIIAAYISAIICHSIFLGLMVKYSDLSYDCSDSITNEVLKQNNSNTTKQIVFTAVNLGLDVLLILVNIIAFTYEKLYDFCKYDVCTYKCNCGCVCPCKKKYNNDALSSNEKNNNNNYFNIQVDKNIVKKDTTINKNMDAPEGPIPYRDVVIYQNIPKSNEPIDKIAPNPIQYPSLEKINKNTNL